MVVTVHGGHWPVVQRRLAGTGSISFWNGGSGRISGKLSRAGPLVAGGAACLWPRLSACRLAVRRSSHAAPRGVSHLSLELALGVLHFWTRWRLLGGWMVCLLPELPSGSSRR